jgi:hypothetical protein
VRKASQARAHAALRDVLTAEIAPGSVRREPERRRQEPRHADGEQRAPGARRRDHDETCSW